MNGEEECEYKKEKRKAYMRNYMRERNLRLKGQPKKKLTDEEKKEKIKHNNRNNYLKNREKAKQYARLKREKQTGMTRVERVKRIINTFTQDEKNEIETHIKI
jgi:hypothetical protein